MSAITPNHIHFHGGVHPEEGKALAENAAIRVAPLLDSYTVILHQHIGAPPKPVVKKGDAVKKGQLLAEAGGFVSAATHSPTSGTVKKIVDCPGPMGTSMESMEIEADGEDAWGSGLDPIENWGEADPATLKDRVVKAGLVGMGGAAFPTHVKLSPPKGVKIDTLILNGAECEPYLTADHRLMLESPEAILEGAAILARILGVSKVIVGIESNKPDAIELLADKAGKFDVKVESMRVRYPQGAEKQLIHALTGREVPAGGLPMNVGCVVQNVATAKAVRDAVVKGEPLVERVTTVTGSPVVEPGNWLLKIGTPIAKVLEFAGGVKFQPAKLILGGPMMGMAQSNLDVTMMKNTSGVLLLANEEVAQFSSEPCIRCGRCVDVCPMNLIPGSLSVMIESEHFDLAEADYAMDCMECGCCAYACPANRPLVQHFKRVKAEINERRKQEK